VLDERCRRFREKSLQRGNAMSISLDGFRILLHEFSGFFSGKRVCTLGYQGVQGSYEELLEIYARENRKLKLIPPEDVIYTAQGGYGYSVDQSVLFSLLGYDEVESIDVSPYEGAAIIHDLNTPIPESLHERFDLVVDGGCAEHILSVKDAFFNIMKMLKPGGSVIHHSPTIGFWNHGFYQFSPTLFFDFYKENGFVNAKMILHFHEKKLWFEVKSDSYIPMSFPERALIYFAATKKHSAPPVIPTQAKYATRIGRELVAQFGGKRLAVWGVGGVFANNYQDFLKENMHLFKEILYLDVDPSRHGTVVNGVPIGSPEILATKVPDVLLVTTSFVKDVIKQLVALNLDGLPLYIHEQWDP
jgi:hypothetical protein